MSGIIREYSCEKCGQFYEQVYLPDDTIILQTLCPIVGCHGTGHLLINIPEPKRKKRKRKETK